MNNIFFNFPRLIINAIINLLKFLFLKKTKEYYLLLSIFLLAVFLRLLGVYPGYPLTHPDEGTIAIAAWRIVLFHDFNPQSYAYGSLLSIIYAIIEFVFFIPLFFIWSFIIHFFDIWQGYYTFRSFQMDLVPHNAFVYWARIETAVLSSLIVVIFYLIGKKLFNKKVGLVVAFLAAIDFRHIASSRQSLPDAPLAVFASLAMLFTIYLIKKPSFKNYLLTGICIGLTISIKYFVYILPTFLLAHLYIGLKQKHLKITSKLKSIFLNKKFIFSCILIVVVFLASNPFFVYNSKGVGAEMSYISIKYGLSNPFGNLLFFINGTNTYSTFKPLQYLLFFSLGWVLSVSVLVGYLYSLVRHFKKTVFLSSLILSFLFTFLIISKDSAFVRNYAAITPFLAFFPAILIVDVSQLIKTKNLSLAFIVVLSFLIGFTSLKNSFISSLSFSKKQNIDMVKQWIDRRFDQESKINIAVSDDFSYFPQADIGKTVFIRPQGKIENMAIDELRQKNITWAFLGSGVTTLTNAQLWAGNQYLIYAFFDQDKLRSFLKNSYIGLSLLELGDYRVAQFVKSFPQSNEPSYFIVKIPDFSEKNKELIKEYNFDSEKSLKDLTISSFVPCEFYKLKYFSSENDLSAVRVGENPKIRISEDCAVETAFIINKSFEVTENGYYKIEGLLKRLMINSPEATNGFLRLDFYSKTNSLLKTYVSPQLDKVKDWQQISLFGIAPSGAKYAKISFQLDIYITGENYLINSFKVYKYNNYNKLNLSDYPYYNKPLPENYYWLLEN